jgi:VHL beta domain
VIVSVFGAGIRVGQIPLVKQLVGVTDAPAAITSQTTCLGLSSTSGTQKAKVTFTNFSDVRTVSVYWLNYDGAAQFKFKIGPRGSQATDSFVSHSWCARDANTGQDVYGVVIRSTSQDVIIPP